MANIKKSETLTDEKVESTNVNKDEIIKAKDNQINDLQSKIDKLDGMMQILMQMNNNSNNNSQPTVMDLTPKIDRPCTLIHLLECPVDLPTVINVNGVVHYFTRFGEERTFRYADIQNIISKYRNWFERGILTLGEDCEDKEDEFGIQIIGKQIPNGIYNKIETLNEKEFESLVKKIHNTQRINLAKTWIQRYYENKDGYKDINKIRILNKYTKDKQLFKNGILADLLKDAIDTESENINN